MELPNDKTEIHLAVPPKKMIFDVNIHRMNQGWYNWMTGQSIQTAFHFLKADEREFIQSGTTPEEWAELFKEEETE